MSKLSQLYQQVILDHSRKPRNFGELKPCTHSCEGYNPLCGDQITVYLNLDENNIVEEIKFDGIGCTISQASASMMTQILKGKTKEEAEKIFQEFQQMLVSDLDINNQQNSLGKLTIFSGVKEYPSRVKCATLAWHTMNSALQSKNKVSTEI
jgi:nitrogen fixation protein NifU and related proteins